VLAQKSGSHGEAGQYRTQQRRVGVPHHYSSAELRIVDPTLLRYGTDLDTLILFCAKPKRWVRGTHVYISVSQQFRDF